MATGFKSKGKHSQDADNQDVSVDAGLYQLETHANDPSNHSGDTGDSSTDGSSSRPISKGAQRFADSRDQSPSPRRQTIRRTPQANAEPEKANPFAGVADHNGNQPVPKAPNDGQSVKPDNHSDTGGQQYGPPVGRQPKSDPNTLRPTDHSAGGGQQFAPPANKAYKNPHPDINPNTDKHLNAIGKAGAGVKAFIARNPKKLKGSGIIGLVIAGLIMMLAPLVGEFKLNIFMNNMTDHGFRHVTHAYVERQRLIMKYWLKEQIDPTFENNHDSGISNYDRSMIKNLYGKLRGDDKIKKKLADAGFKIVTKADINWPKGRITSISYKGHELNQGSFEVEYHTLFEPQTADELKHSVNLNHDISLIADDVFHGTRAQKRRVARRMQIIMGVKLHWIDKTTLPIKELRNKIRNQVVVFILEHSGAARAAAAQMLAYILGEKIDQETLKTLSNAGAKTVIGASGELTTATVSKVTAEGLTKALGKLGFDASNPIGWALLLISANCYINKIYTDGYSTFQQLAIDKSGAEYAVQFIAMASALSQLHDPVNNTDEKSMGVFMELLVDKANRDYALNNNYRRSTGEDVPYYHTNDCESGLELCDDKRGQTMIDGTLVGKAAKRAEQDPQLHSKFARYALFMGPTGIGTEYFCKLMNGISDLAGNVLMAILKANDAIFTTPLQRQIQNEIQNDTSNFIMEKMFMPMVGWLIPPVVDAETRGPALANAVAAGALHVAGQYMREFCGTLAFGDPEAAKKCRLEGPDLRAAETSIQQEDVRRNQAAPLWDKLASLDNPRSVLSRLVVSTPNNPQELMARIANIPRLFFPPAMVQAVATANPGWFSNDTAFAADPKGPPEKKFDPTGEPVYGYTTDCLRKTKLHDGSNPDCAGLDRWDDSIACDTMSQLTEGQDVPTECNAALNPQVAAASSVDTSGIANLADMCKVGPGGAEASPNDCAAFWADKMLHNPNITWDKKGENKVVGEDLTRAAHGQPTNNQADTHGADAYLHPNLLFALEKTAEAGFKIDIWNIVSKHGWDQYLHPKGRASDIGGVNDGKGGPIIATDSTGSKTGPNNRAFAETIAKFLPPGGEILQANTTGNSGDRNCKWTATLPDYISDSGHDTCNHIHVSAGSKVK